MKLKTMKIGLGTGTLASLGRGTTLEMVRNILAAARDAGVSVVDTADSYTSGRCERLLGYALTDFRDDFVLITKAGYRHGDLDGPLKFLNPIIKKAWQKVGRAQSFRPRYLSESLDRSLSRLRTDHVDGFLLHDPPPDVVSDPDVVAHLTGLKESGKVREVGVSSRDPETIRRVVESENFSILQSPLTAFTRCEFDSMWEKAVESGLRLIANNVFFSGRLPESNEWVELSRDYGISHHELLMRYAASKPYFESILVGTRQPKHLRQCIGWAGNPLPPAEVVRVEVALATRG